MYGLVNLAIQQLVIDRFGEAKWNEVKQKSGVDILTFVSMEQYPDKLTYALVVAASEVLETPTETLLEEFGKYWTLYTAKEGYEDFLEMGGTSVKEFLANLNNLHTRVGSMFPGFKPPVFKITDRKGTSLKLHYFSERPGLAPMVIGLVKGLAKRFNTQITIELVAAKAKGHDHDEFEVHFGN